MRVLKYGHETSKMIEVPPHYQFGVGFSSWIHETDLAGFTAWATIPGNIEGPYWMYKRGHTWWFELESDMIRFLAHRPMANRALYAPVERVVAETVYPHRVEINQRMSYPEIHRLIDPDWEDFFWELVEEWIARESRGRVVVAVGKDDLRLRKIRYEFEDPRDAFAFKMRWL